MVYTNDTVVTRQNFKKLVSDIVTGLKGGKWPGNLIGKTTGVTLGDSSIFYIFLNTPSPEFGSMDETRTRIIVGIYGNYDEDTPEILPIGIDAYWADERNESVGESIHSAKGSPTKTVAMLRKQIEEAIRESVKEWKRTYGRETKRFIDSYDKVKDLLESISDLSSYELKELSRVLNEDPIVGMGKIEITPQILYDSILEEVQVLLDSQKENYSITKLLSDEGFEIKKEGSLVSVRVFISGGLRINVYRGNSATTATGVGDKENAIRIIKNAFGIK